jgi:hypothetical protein
MIRNSALGFCIAASALVLSGCETPEDSSTTVTRDGNVDVVMNFAMDSAVALVANADITEGTRSLETGLFEYRIIGGSKARMGISERTVLSRDSSDASEVVGSNLQALDAEGGLKPAMETNFPTKVMYSVGSPNGDKVYLALDPGWFDNDQTVDADGRRIDFSRVIAETKCALVEVTVANNEHSCVAEGVFVQNMNDAYKQAVSGNQKPIQFDGDGNLYFAGTTFSVVENSWNDCFFDNQNNQEICETRVDKWIETTDWQPRIFRRLVNEDTPTAITQDNEMIQFFTVLKSGELVYQSYNENSQENVLKMLQDNDVIDLSSGWGLDFFTVDDSNTVIFGAAGGGGSAANGLRFARPLASGGASKASLDTTLFGGDSGSGGWGNPVPRRLLVGDNGRIYGVFEGGRPVLDANGQPSGHETVLTVYQILPFDGVPKLELVLGDKDWWSFMQNTPFQVTGDTLFYSASVSVNNYGTSDVIRMVDLNTRLQTQLLTADDNGAGRYEIYNWRLAGDELHFSGLRKDGNTVVTGVIETTKFTPEAESSTYLTVTESASASGAASAIQDIEILRQVSTVVDPKTEPTPTFFQSMDNLYSMSIDFPASMNTASVEKNLSLVAGITEIDIMKVWVNKTLHLIPDLDGLGDSTGTTPLAANTAYTLTVAATTNDVFGNALVSDASQTVTTRPSSGWYIDTSKTLLYAGRADGKRKWSTYDVSGATVSNHFELIFDAKNFGWQGIELYLFDVASGLPNQRTDFRMSLGSWSWLDYPTSTSNSNWSDGETPSVFNGSWKTYRIRVYGGTLSVETKVLGEDDSTYQPVADLSVTDLANRNGADNRLFLRVNEPIGFDNFVLNSLNSDGTDNVSNVYAEDFSGSIPATYSADLTASYDDLYD